MTPVASPAEITTSLTDVLLAVESLVIAAWLWRHKAGNRWKAGVWVWVFGLMAAASVLGAVTHGLVLPLFLNEILWKPLYLCLGLAVSLFLVGVLFDWQGRDVARRFMPASIVAGLSFFLITLFYSTAFLVFVLYEAAVMVFSLAVYVYLGSTRRLRGAGMMAVAILVSLVAAGIQSSGMAFTLVVPFDHNGIFHLVQLAGLGLLGIGLNSSLTHTARPVEAARK